MQEKTSGSSKYDLKHKFDPSDSEAAHFFVQQGYVMYHNVYDQELIQSSADFLRSQYDKLLARHKDGVVPFDVNGWAFAIMEKFQRTPMYDAFIGCKNIVKIMKQYLGLDVAVLGFDALWINVPQDKDPVLLKGLHNDAWTGTSINTIFAKTFFTDVDQYNGMSVCPGSHLQGMIPVRNRAIDPSLNVQFEPLNMDHAKAGDFLIWHALLIHSTTGHSDKHIRMSVTSRYTSTESSFSSQERSLGYRALSVGPMNQVLRLIGNDYLTPLRTYGGFVGVDRRLADLYGYSDYKVDIDYRQYLD